jgi:NADH:ubiquinone oxidoreductase subunit 6 (subunit J)
VNFSEIVFILILLVTMVGALMTVLSGSIIYAMVGLVTTMFGIAGLYIYLNAPFLGMMQILIYVGAISILIAFAIMLAGPLYQKPKEWTTGTKFIVSLITALFSFFVLSKIIVRPFWRQATVNPFTVSTKDIGRVLFDKLMLPFELISLLITIGIIGAIMLALFSKGEK